MTFKFVIHWICTTDPATCVYRFKHNDPKGVLFEGSNVLLNLQLGDSHPIVKNYHEIVTKSCDESRIKRFSNKSKEISKLICAQIYAYLCPMLLIMSNSARRDEFMANYNFRRKVKCKVRGFRQGFC